MEPEEAEEICDDGVECGLGPLDVTTTSADGQEVTKTLHFCAVSGVIFSQPETFQGVVSV